ncbi:hypothetical protein ANCDUO_15512 [Ancylostoma duodenale]|uniref:Uncharacterized protein n=1 Tax=Ancylostoma duodenale TaxID=51022 RepID=A0A0C2CDD1_9BILA|nr:hypothetical protein ANCDUO_15512 [Ancylostoma duodenale]
MLQNDTFDDDFCIYTVRLENDITLPSRSDNFVIALIEGSFPHDIEEATTNQDVILAIFVIVLILSITPRYQNNGFTEYLCSNARKLRDKSKKC